MKELYKFYLEEQKTIQELLFIFNVLPEIAAKSPIKKDSFGIWHIAITNSDCLAVTGARLAMSLMKNPAEPKSKNGGLILVRQESTSEVIFYAQKTTNKDMVLLAFLKPKSQELTVKIFHNGSWTKVLRHIFMQEIGEIRLSSRIPPWNFEPFAF